MSTKPLEDPTAVDPIAADPIATDPVAVEPVPTRAAASTPARAAKRRSGAAAVLVAAGILLSRVAGFARERAFAHVFGNSVAADAFKAALRIPNFLQNLLGEGILSASFTPVYSKLEQEDPAQAARVAAAVGTLLAVVTTILTALGVLAAPWIVDVIVAGFEGEKRDVTVHIVRVLFPSTGLLVASAWCLSILNTHDKFFASYAAPASWNLVMIVALLVVHDPSQWVLVERLAWAAVLGSAVQLAVQLPFLWPHLRGMVPHLALQDRHMREVLRNFGPAVLGRGVVQVSAFIESMIASFLPTGAIAAIAYAQMLTMLPTSLFGASIAAAELPSMAREDAGPGSRAALAQRLRTGADRIAFFVVPSAVAFFALGDVVAGVVFQTGEFTSADARIVWSIIAAQSIGLVASTQARLVSNAFFAMKDTRTPLRCAIARVVVGLALGALFSLAAPLVLDIPPAYRAAGIGLGSSLGAVVELIALRKALAKVVEGGSGSMALVPRVLAASAASALVAHIAHLGLDPMRLPVWLEGLVVLAVYGGVYLGLTVLLRVGEARAFVDKISRAARRQKS